ncbi:hypothetical protein PRV_01035 [Mycoplasma parvum str. Indiana]|uniref:Uncharacterized protein n=1 Tax=Mycoplasma parvum str. Indiana TaxID=1403316 RepID=U5NBN9_9MOLU|nr:hypothetical protein PRV_01035 [Mycoplasma parvum str. Indiana]
MFFKEILSKFTKEIKFINISKNLMLGVISLFIFINLYNKRFFH